MKRKIYVIRDHQGNEIKVQETELDEATAIEHVKRLNNPRERNIHNPVYCVRPKWVTD